MLEYRIWAYAILVKEGSYIIEEGQREEQSQQLVPTDYTIAVSQKLLTL